MSAVPACDLCAGGCAVDAPPADVGALRDALRLLGAPWAAGADAPGALPDVVEALEEAWAA